MTAEKLTAEHVLAVCAKCSFLRLVKRNVVACGLCDEDLQKGEFTLLEISEKNKLGLVRRGCQGKPGLVNLISVINEISHQVRETNRGLLGFSTGCLYQSNLPLVERLKAYLRAGSTIVELSFKRPEDLLEFKLTDKDMSKLRKLSAITIHAPWRGIRYFAGGGSDAVLAKLTQLCDQLLIRGVVFHPNIVAKFSGLEVVNLPVLIENMSRRNDFGIRPEEMSQIRADYGFGFVLDLQHAFEHDPTMVLARELADAMGDNISHFHVSGQNSKEPKHAPVHLADNRREIMQTLNLLPGAPVVMEGVLSGNAFELTKREFAFVQGGGK